MHYCLLVVSNTNNDDEIEALMEPFRERGTLGPEEEDEELSDEERNQQRWDWFVYGGRWSGELLRKRGQYVDQCQAKDLDLETLRSEAEKRARDTFALFENAFVGQDIPEYPHAGTQQEQKEFWDHPVIVAIEDIHRAAITFGQELDYLSGKFARHYFCNGDLEEFVHKARKRVLVPEAVLLPHGEWMEPESTHYFGEPRTEWYERVSHVLEHLRDDHVLTIVDCHT